MNTVPGRDIKDRFTVGVSNKEKIDNPYIKVRELPRLVKMAQEYNESKYHHTK